MRCPKCDGLMYIEHIADFFILFQAWKCINCGAMFDETILDNHEKSVVGEAVSHR